MTCLTINETITKQPIHQTMKTHPPCIQELCMNLPLAHLRHHHLYPKECLKLDFYLVANLQPP